MSQKIQFRRGTNANRTGIIFSNGEPIWTTDTHKMYVGDGITSGGNVVAEIVTGAVLLTGNQTITGRKVFKGNAISTNEIRNESGNLIFDLTDSFLKIYNNNILAINIADKVLTGLNSCVVNWYNGLLYNNSLNITMDWNNRVLSGNWQVATASPPTGGYNSNGVKGSLAISGGYLYACTGDNLWGRSQLLSF